MGVLAFGSGGPRATIPDDAAMRQTSGLFRDGIEERALEIRGSHGGIQPGGKPPEPCPGLLGRQPIGKEFHGAVRKAVATARDVAPLEEEGAEPILLLAWTEELHPAAAR